MKACAAALFLLFPSLALANSNDPPIALSEYQKQDWHVEDGLEQSNVRTIIQIPSRLLLVGTSEGMASFDGLHFTSLKMDSTAGTANEPVNALLMSRNGDLWIGTDDRGVIRRRGQESLAISEQAGFHEERIRALFQDETGTIWVATQNGIERIVGDHIEPLTSLGLVSGDITAPFAEDGRGGMFIVTSNGLFLWRNSKAESFPIAHRELGEVTAVHGDGKGNVWVGLTRGLVKLTQKQSGGYAEEMLPGVHGPVTSLVRDREGNIWVGTKGHGICHVSWSGVTSHWTTSDGLPDDTIHTLFEDDEGNLWIGTLSGGISRWRKSTLVPFGQPEGLPNSFAANALGDRRGDLWLGTWGSGLLRIKQGKLRKENLEGAPSTAQIRSLAEDSHGDIWIGTWFNGLYKYDGKTFQHFLTGSESLANAIGVLLYDRQGRLWVGTYKGLICFPSGVPSKNKGETFLKDKLITSLKEDQDGAIFVGTFEGLYRLRDSTVESITQQDGLSNSFILSISTDSLGGVWVGTKAGGVDFVQGRRLTHIRPETGIPAYPVFSVLDDGHGLLWMSTTRGLLRVSVTQMHEAAEGNRKTVDAVLLGKNDGMRSSECGGMSQPSATKTKDGVLWFATAKGFVHTNPSEPSFPIPLPQARITGSTIDRTTIHALDRLILEAGATDFEVQFDAVRLANPSQLQFRYKLEGYDSDWTVVNARHAEYRHLPPGHYRFLVSAHDAGQPWGDNVAVLTVAQKPFFRQTSLFLILSAILLVGVAAILLRWRVARVKGRLRMIMEERNRIAREWHDTLMAGFAAISWQLEATSERLGGGAKEAVAHLDLARNMVRHSQTEARRIIWDLHDKPEPVGPLSEALSKAIGGMSAKLRSQIQLRVTGDEIVLPPLVVHHLVRICLEAVTNAIRHAAATMLQVDLQYRAVGLALSVKDDGRGFVLAQGAAPGHFGLAVMEERARKVGGVLKVRSSPGEGTEILVEVSVVKELGKS